MAALPPPPVHSRWHLRDLRAVLPWLAGRSLSAVWRVLKRLGFRYKLAQLFMRSPDPQSDAKRRAISQALIRALLEPAQVKVLFMDEFSYYRQPTLARAWHAHPDSQPRAYPVARANTRTRLLATLEACSAQVCYCQRSAIGVKVLCDFYAQLRQAYADVPTLYVVQDNWPPHRHPQVLAAAAQHGLTPLFLPTYASWLNPIEKLWRWLKQAVIQLHRFADDLETLRQRVRDFLDRFQHGSADLLRYVGLSVD